MNKSTVSIGLTNPKSPTNVGAVMRAAGCFDVDAVYYTGKRYQRAAKFDTDTQNACNDIPLENVECLLAAVPENAKIVCVELALGATSLTEYQHPENAFYIFGPEDNSISQQVIDRADAVVYIPSKSCLNLAASVNVVLYDRLAKSGTQFQGDDLILQARDQNNRIKVKKA